MPEGGEGCADTSSPVPQGRQVSSCREDVQTILAFVALLFYVSDKRNGLGRSLACPSQCNPGLCVFVALVMKRMAGNLGRGCCAEMS